MLRTAFAAMAGALLLLAGCGGTTTPEQKHELGCAAGTLTGALIGGLAGHAFGGGKGQDFMTAAGAGIGAGVGTLACR
ncbi:hypothetical protein [Amaricoccus sp. W119]|uniref:hypothetical protein n=1 Tax=Amaricoccus sp. W119 TaxID=3391833 RepID=UPI0039A642BE